MTQVKHSSSTPSKDDGILHIHPQPSQEEIPPGHIAPQRDFIKVNEAATRLSLSTRTVHRMLDRGDIPCESFGKSRRIPARLFDQWIEDHIANSIAEQRKRKGL
jgi:excisionase family DNA binding protein